MLIGFMAVTGMVAGFWIADPLGSATKQGRDNAAILTFVDQDGKVGTLDDFRGGYVLLNVWATWCAPCRKEMPSLDRLQAARGGPDFKVVALSIDRGGIEQVRPFYEEIGIKNLGTFLDQPGASMKAFRIVGLPTTLLIGKDGKELARWVGPKEWDEPGTVKEIDGILASSSGAGS
ncbi:TlpA family protein disulfide reductase [Rhizobium sp.]